MHRLQPHARRAFSIALPFVMTAIFTLALLGLARVNTGMNMASTSQKTSLSQNLREAIGTFVNNNALKIAFINNEPRFLLGVSGTELAGVHAKNGTLRFGDQEVVFGSHFANNDDLKQIFGSSTLKKVGVLEKTGTTLDWLTIMNKKTFESLPSHGEIRTVSTSGELKLFLVTATSTLAVFPTPLQESLAHVGEEMVLDGVTHQTVALGVRLAKKLQDASSPSKPHARFENLLGKKAVVIEVLPETHTLLDEAYFVGSAFSLHGGM